MWSKICAVLRAVLPNMPTKLLWVWSELHSLNHHNIYFLSSILVSFLSFSFWLLATLSHSMRRLPYTRDWSTGILFSIWDQSVRMASSRSSWRRFLEVWHALLIVLWHYLLSFPLWWHGGMLISVKSVEKSLVLRMGVLCVGRSIAGCLTEICFTEQHRPVQKINLRVICGSVT